MKRSPVFLQEDAGTPELLRLAYFTIFIFLFQNIRDILLIGHRQAVAWLDEWHGQSDARTPSRRKRTPSERSSRVAAGSEGAF